MKLITQYSDSHDAESVSGRIRRAGVMTVVSSKRSHTLSSVRTGAFRVGLWVVFDDQYEDAIQLLENKDHKPRRVISLNEMMNMELNASKQLASVWKRFLENSAALLLGGILMAILIYVTWGILNDA